MTGYALLRERGIELVSVDDAVEFPADEKRRLGLDDQPSWIVTSEANRFIWPGPDIRPVPGRPAGTLIYGQLARGMVEQVARSYLANHQKRRARAAARTS